MERVLALYQKGLNLLYLETNSPQGISYIKRSADLGFWVAREYLDNLNNKT